MTDEKHLWCAVCEGRVGVAQLDGHAKLVCHCTHVDGRIEPVDLDVLSVLPEGWEYR